MESLHSDILEGLKHNKFAQEQLRSIPFPPDSHYSVSNSGFLLIDSCIYIPDYHPQSGSVHTHVLQLKHNHITAGHPRQNRMLELLRREYTWPNVHTDIKDYVNSCISCKQNKAPRHKPFGLIQQLPIPLRLWHSISFDLIEQLLASKGHTAILNIIKQASKQLISIPTNNKVTAPEIAQLFLHHIFAKHSVPLHVTCDCGSEFTLQFFQSLGTLLNINLHFTSGYNPQANGQSERANQTLKQYLRHYCTYQQDNWSKLLLLAEFTYNNAPNASTGLLPFFANKGYHLALDIHLEHDVASLWACEFAMNLQELHLYLANSLKLAQERYQAASDPHRTPPPLFNPGDEVFILSKFIHTTRPSQTLSERYIGPFKIIDCIGRNSIHVSLPNDLCRIHPVFHVSQLEPHIPD